MALLSIAVSQRDIALGVRESSEACPVARATSRLLGALYAVSVDGRWIELEPHGAGRDRLHLRLPRQARAFVDDYDRRIPVSPLTFDVQVPDYLVDDAELPAFVAPGQLEAGLLVAA